MNDTYPAFQALSHEPIGLPIVQPKVDPTNELQAAIQQWQIVLGKQHVLTDDETLERMSRSTLPIANKPLAVLRPANTREVSAVVQIAAEHGQSLYPISRGKNWGYGSACPTTAGQVVLDLGRMNRILEINEDLGYAIVEPGVAQGQLFEELQSRRAPLMLDVTGAGPDASIVGNTLERGFGHTPYGDHFAHSCGFEVVLPDGNVIDTGFGGFENAQATNVFANGIGPHTDGLFSQSNFGIVTRMTIWLMRQPERIKAFAVRMKDESLLEPLIEVLRELRQEDILRTTVHVANDLRLLSSLVECPIEEREAKTALSDQTRANLRESTGTGAWNLLGAFYGDRATINLAQKQIARRLKPFGRAIFFDRNTIKRWEMMLKPLGQGKTLGLMRAKIASAKSALDMISGIPTKEHLKGAFWRNARNDHDRTDPSESGLIWISPVFPMTGEHARKVLSIVEPTLQRYGFDPLVTLTAINQRAMCGVISINYDRGDEEETGRAQECYDTVWTQLETAGYLPYRCATQSMEKLGKANKNSAFFQSLKSAIDPKGIISPGRYGIE